MKTEHDLSVDDTNHADKSDENPFGFPDVMNGYPLEPGERKALDRLLAEFRRRHADERSRSGRQPASGVELQQS